MARISTECEKYDQDIRAQNVAACNALLSRLIQFHGEAPPAPIIIEPPPAEAVEVASPPVSPNWIKFIQELPDPRGPSVKEIKLCVSHYFKVSPRDLESPRRLHKFVVPRQVAFYLARKLTSRSFPEIGRKFGGRDHTTILHGSKVVERRMETDAQFAETVRMLEEQLQ